MHVYALIAYYTDGSDEPEVLRVFDSPEAAEDVQEMIEKAEPSKRVIICRSWMDAPSTEEDAE